MSVSWVVVAWSRTESALQFIHSLYSTLAWDACALLARSIERSPGMESRFQDWDERLGLEKGVGAGAGIRNVCALFYCITTSWAGLSQHRYSYIVTASLSVYVNRAI